ncbi:hypothetical protein WL30_32130 [Burkholderia ubonensis]|nr:hypothetical protein WJ76_24030 [Burkholderia ubonensis]KWA79435.1 hypothetical protein WL30_32130 [Burkholderia ubonensis]KWB28906.1 hypothetical protein WL31_29120 [Burkholderia ubonensis]
MGGSSSFLRILQRISKCAGRYVDTCLLRLIDQLLHRISLRPSCIDMGAYLWHCITYGDALF